MIRIGEASVAQDNGEIRNGFETVKLGSKLEVVVPTLVMVGDETTEMFDLRTERLAKRSRQLRIMATCICDEGCHQTHLVDDGDRRATEFFKPHEGLQLGTGELPSVLAHSFGLITMMMGDAPKLWDEVHADPTVGLVVPTGTN